MGNRQEVQQGENSLQEEIREPLIPEDKTRADEEDGYGAKDQSHKSSTMEHEWMVYLSTFVAVCGSYAFGTCAGYSSPTQSAITDDLDLSLAEQAMRVSSGFCIAGWLAIYFAEGALVLDIGRLATGYAMGAFSYVLMIVAGVSVSYIIGTVLTWRVLALIGLHRNPSAAPKGQTAGFVSKKILALRFPSSTGTIIYACIQVPITALGATLIDKAGRKPLLLVSGSGLVIGCALTAISFYLEVHEIAVNASPILAVTGILVYIGAFSVGMGAVPWVIMSEIFPINVKGVGGSLATLVNWFIAWLVSYTFNYLMAWSSYGTFILYGAINLLAILFIVMVVPETKGRTLEQLQAAINI
ncbi:hypothetical protein TEA_020704 [Camellia sinensis var. sinensis]|uniref:Major facilitator superfamily (MFS) profile domain-containing protein n=1 Tax=Camellia sinensis var. sinensis TaxID=542762 RepID=A0A4S4EGA4_CAMSN|nr:hypothetical protein TEA_020704 [Camellia sinensis var. sinensis]